MFSPRAVFPVSKSAARTLEGGERFKVELRMTLLASHIVQLRWLYLMHPAFSESLLVIPWRAGQLGNKRSKTSN